MVFKCLLCGANEMSVTKQKTRNSTHRIVTCSKCGLQQLFPLPSVEEDKEYYDCNFHDRQITPDFNIDQIYDKFYPQNAYRMQYLKDDIKLDKQWHILDYACGYGFLMELLLKEGYNVEGVEISEEKIEIIRRRSGQSGGGVSTYDRLKTFNLMEKDVTVPDDMYEKYDLVTMFHLIEHITTPVDFLQKVASLIKPNGYLLMEMPNVANMIMDVSSYFSDFFYIRDHVAYYTPELLKHMVEKAGYTVIKQRGTQIYSILNHMNWIINGIPQYINPSYDVPAELKWLDDYYKTYLDKTIKSEYMYLLAKKV